MLDRPDLVDHLLFVILAAVLGPRAFFVFRRLRTATPEELVARRPRTYRMAMITQWVLAAGLLAQWTLNGRTWRALGLAPLLTPGAIGVAGGLLIMVVLLFLRNRRPGEREIALERARGRIQHVEFILPHTPRELRLFTALSVTAGICEELLYRGFMIWYLAHRTGELQAALLSSLLFGLGHMYQGLRGVLLTGAVGFFMSAIYLVSGSLYLPMLIHAGVDISAGRTGYALLRAEVGTEGAPGPKPGSA